MKVKSSASKQHPLPGHIQYHYRPSMIWGTPQTWLTNLVWIWLRHRGGCRHPQNRALHQHCSATNQLPKGPASPDGSLKAKAKCETVIQCKIHQARACKHLNTSETETYLRVHTLKCRTTASQLPSALLVPFIYTQNKGAKAAFKMLYSTSVML